MKPWLFRRQSRRVSPPWSQNQSPENDNEFKNRPHLEKIGIPGAKRDSNIASPIPVKMEARRIIKLESKQIHAIGTCPSTEVEAFIMPRA